MVHFAMREAREQCLRHRCAHCQRPLWAAAQLDAMQARGGEGIACTSCTCACNRYYSRCLQAWVVLPHCMQTSAGFWARVGFELGAEVDKKEAKMAVLRSVGDLKGDVDGWSHSLTGPNGSPAARPEGGDGTLCMCVRK